MRYFILPILLFLINSVLLSQPGVDYDYYKKGREHAENRNFEDAIYFYNKAIELNSGTSIYFDNRGFAKYQLNDLTGAIQDYKIASSMVPDEPAYYYMIGNIYQKTDSLDKATNYYTRAIELSSTKDNDYYYARANTYFKRADYTRAISDYDQCLDLESDNITIYNNRGISYFRIQDTLNACLDWEHALKGGHSPAKRYLKSYCKKYISPESVSEIVLQYEAAKNRIPAKFQGQSQEEFRQYIAKNLRYPQMAAEYGHQGAVIANFTIAEDGRLVDLMIVNGEHKALNKEALRVIATSDGMWEPAIENGKSVSSELSFPIRFVISSELFFPLNIKKFSSTASRNYENGDYDKAIKAANKYLSRNPYSEEMWKLRANAKEESGDTLGANEDRAIMKFLIDLNSKPNFQIQKADYLDVSKDTVFRVEIFLDSIWQICEMNNASYVRISKWNSKRNFFEGEFRDVTTENKLLSFGKIERGNLQDSLIVYHNSGTVALRARFNDGIPIGEWCFLDESGNTEKIVSFMDKSFIIKEQYILDDTIVFNGTGNWQLTLKTWGVEDHLHISGQFVDSRREGRWEVYEGKILVLREVYKKDKFLRGSYYGPEGKQSTNFANINSWIFVPGFIERIHTLIFDPSIDPSIYPFIKNNSIELSF